jgi:hypothetical protein
VDQRLRWVVLGWCAGLATAAVLTVLAVAFVELRSRPDGDGGDRAARLRRSVLRSVDPVVVPRRLVAVPHEVLPSATLTVHDDGCGVIRTDVPPTVDNLTWHIEDPDGFQVLDRAAESETRYRYFRPGSYTVVLRAFDGSAYVPISNRVTITC